jgi:hypothetical protein
MNDPRDRQLAVLAGLVQLERRVRAAATLQELAFLIVNDTHTLVPYRQAVLWRADTGTVQAMSGLAVPEADAPFNLWITKLMRQWATESAPPRAVTAHDLDPAEWDAWAEHLPANALIVPLLAADPQPDAVPADVKPTAPALLLLARDTPWQDGERQIVDLLGDAYAYAWKALAGSRQARWQLVRRHWRNRRVLGGVAAAVLLLALFPVRQSVLAPAEIVAANPVIVRAPVTGVVERILVAPNQTVAEGQPLVQMDGRELESRLEVARQALAIAEAEHRQAQQQAVFDERAKSSLAVLAARRDQAAADVAFVQEMLGRIRIAATRPGIAIYDNPDDWAGRPVSLGERILMVADPADTRLEVHLPVGDAITLEPGTPIDFFLNIDPAAPLEATLIRAGYRAGMTPEGVMAYRLAARFADGTGDAARRRVGLKGTAKLHGERTILLLYLLRRPLAAIRIKLGV